MGTLKFRSVEHQTVRLVGGRKNHAIAQRVITTVSDVSFVFLFPFFFKDSRNAKMQKCKIEANVSEREKIVKEVLRKRQ